MDILNRIEMMIDESSIDQLKSDIQKEFNKGNSKSLVWNRIKRMYRNINKKQFDKICKSLNESTVTGDVAVNRAKGHVDVVDAKYKKKKKRSKLTGAPIVVYEDEELDESVYKNALPKAPKNISTKNGTISFNVKPPKLKGEKPSYSAFIMSNNGGMKTLSGYIRVSDIKKDAKEMLIKLSEEE